MEVSQVLMVALLVVAQGLVVDLAVYIGALPVASEKFVFLLVG